MTTQINLNVEQARENRPFLWQIEQIDREFSTETSREEKINNFFINEEQIKLVRKLIPEIHFQKIKTEGRTNKPYLWKISEIDRVNALESARDQWENELKLNYEQSAQLKETLNELSNN
jgi:hypothetical protein